jgi:hypothetical protein
MPTPENIVKQKVRKVLDKFKAHIDGFWPVPAGYGESHLDYVGCCCGQFFAIETKAPGKKPTPRQNKRIEDVKRAGGWVFVIDGTEATTTYDELEAHLMLIVKESA